MTANVNLPEKAIGESLKEAALQGATTRADIFKKAAAYLDERMTCDLIMTEDVRPEYIGQRGGREIYLFAPYDVFVEGKRSLILS